MQHHQLRMESENPNYLNFDENVRVSGKRRTILQKFFQIVCDDLHLKGVECNVFPNSEFPRYYLGMCHDEVSIEIKVMNDFRLMLSTLAHELRHCWQWQTDTLIWNENDEEKIWRGKKIIEDGNEEPPWELDALFYEDQVASKINELIEENFYE